jgi:dolichyldiphosphatase
MFAGQLGCEAVNFALKRIIKEERPRRIHGKGYGMPSSHAQFVAFWSVSLTLFLLLRHKPPRILKRNHRPWYFVERVAVSGMALAIAATVAWSRVYLNYHTPTQVLVGSLAGVLSAIAWFGVTMVVRDIGLLSWALNLSIVRWFRIRDLVIEEDLCQAGWEKWEDKTQASRNAEAKKIE